MKILFLINSFLFVIVGCQAPMLVVKPLELVNLKNENSIRIEFDKGDPISYILTLDKGLLTMTIYTHKKKKNFLIRENVILSDSLSISYFKNLGLLDLKDCNSYKGYECIGLDGAIVTVEFIEASKLNRFEYWSPEAQVHTSLGKLLTEVKEKIETDFHIIKHTDKFYGSLKKGVYWNYGEAVLTK